MDFVMFFIYLLCFGLAFWLLWYLVNNLAPEPFRRVLNIILMVIGVLALIIFLIEYVGPLLEHGMGRPYLR
jgi:hypothetical protein